MTDLGDTGSFLMIAPLDVISRIFDLQPAAEARVKYETRTAGDFCVLHRNDRRWSLGDMRSVIVKPSRFLP